MRNNGTGGQLVSYSENNADGLSRPPGNLVRTSLDKHCIGSHREKEIGEGHVEHGEEIWKRKKSDYSSAKVRWALYGTNRLASTKAN